MSFTTEQSELLGQKLPQSAVKQRKQGGGNVSYIEGHHAIREANRIFEFDGWERFTDFMSLVQCEQGQTDADRRWKVAYVAKVRVVACGVTREGYGFGNGLNADLGSAHELAVKEAETDAMKRAMMTFGDPFGLALYDKTQANVDKGIPVTINNARTVASIAAQAITPQPLGPTVSAGEKERNAGLYIRRTIQADKPQFDAFKGACEAENASWVETALDAEQKGVRTFIALMEFVTEGKVPQEVA